MSRKPWMVLGLAVFLAVDIFLVALALGWGRDVPEPAGWQAPNPASTQTEDGSEDTSDEPESPRESRQTQAAPRLLSGVSETVAWRSEGGACEERGEIELTVDGGETWGSAYPATGGLGRPLWLSGADYTAVQAAIASGDDCLADGVRTYDSGATWIQEDQVLANSVFIDPRDSSSLIWGGELIEGPCSAMTQVSVTGGVASVVCDDGSLMSLGTNSSAWAESEIDDVIAVSGSDGRWIAAVESADCDGLRLLEFNVSPIQALSCVPANADDSVTLGLSGNTLWLWAGNQVTVSTDLGRSLDS